MKRKEIIMMAKEAGFREDLFSGGPRKGKVSIFDFGDVDIFDNLERFAALVSAAERERAAFTPNDRVEGRDAASSRRVPSHDGLAGNVTTKKGL